MNQSAKKRHHEEARKKHKHDMQEHARKAARRGKSRVPLVLLVGGVVALIAFVLFVSFR
ncbi:MAG TPA: hypothetical protein VGE74_01355 [Gemmata sp.]